MNDEVRDDGVPAEVLSAGWPDDRLDARYCRCCFWRIATGLWACMVACKDVYDRLEELLW